MTSYQAKLKWIKINTAFINKEEITVEEENVSYNRIDLANDSINRVYGV